MFKKIILSLILLLNLIFAKNDSDVNFDFKTDKFGRLIDEFEQLIDEEGYVKPENYMDFFQYRRYKIGIRIPDKYWFEYLIRIDKSKYQDNLKLLNKWRKKCKEAEYGNQWDKDSKDYINPETYEFFLNNKNFFNENIEIYWDQRRELENWRDKWKKAGYGDQWDEDSENNINPETYKDPGSNKLFFNNDKKRYYDQRFELNEWNFFCEEAIRKEEIWKEVIKRNKISFFDKIKNFFNI